MSKNYKVNTYESNIYEKLEGKIYDVKETLQGTQPELFIPHITRAFIAFYRTNKFKANHYYNSYLIETHSDKVYYFYPEIFQRDVQLTNSLSQ